MGSQTAKPSSWSHSMSFSLTGRGHFHTARQAPHTVRLSTIKVAGNFTHPHRNDPVRAQCLQPAMSAILSKPPRRVCLSMTWRIWMSAQSLQHRSEVALEYQYQLESIIRLAQVLNEPCIGVRWQSGHADSMAPSKLLAAYTTCVS